MLPMRAWATKQRPEFARLFVYGQLRRSFPEHYMLAGARFLGDAQTAPLFFVVTLTGDERILVPGGTESVSGELYEVDHAKLEALDGYELDVYEREAIPLNDGTTAFAFVLKEDRRAQVAGELEDQKGPRSRPLGIQSTPR